MKEKIEMKDSEIIAMMSITMITRKVMRILIMKNKIEMQEISNRTNKTKIIKTMNKVDKNNRGKMDSK